MARKRASLRTMRCSHSPASEAASARPPRDPSLQRPLRLQPMKKWTFLAWAGRTSRPPVLHLKINPQQLQPLTSWETCSGVHLSQAVGPHPLSPPHIKWPPTLPPLVPLLLHRVRRSEACSVYFGCSAELVLLLLYNCNRLKTLFNENFLFLVFNMFF